MLRKAAAAAKFDDPSWHTMPRFVVLIHDHPVLHWDLMLEEPQSLRTWRLAARPAAGAEIEAEALAPHRITYLDYEGPVSGGRGSVSRDASGHYSLLEDTPAEVRISLVCEGFPDSCVLRHVGGTHWIACFSS